tara:strand:+ start:2848 stop:3672 length:825 start_codon:yes stop_codon:yes gene_type:complete
MTENYQTKIISSIYKKSPYFSIITIVYNDEKNIEKTIKNIISQKFKNFEFIVVYTPSSDQTLKKIIKYKNKINKIIVCKKKGIYHNMNVGAKFAKGKYINFMNSGDYFLNNKVLKDIFNRKYKSDVIYGDCKIKYSNNYERRIIAKDIVKIYFGMIFSHQSSFVKKKLVKENKFNLNFYLAADYDFFLKLFKKKKKFEYYKKIISLRSPFGISTQKDYITIFQNLIIVNKIFKNISLKINIILIFRIFYYFIINRFFLLFQNSFKEFFIKLIRK